MPSPYVEYHIDFDEDKVLESAEEVSTDMKALLLTRGKDLQANRAPASTLTTTMHNHDGKYTPINSSSPLYPFQLPGPDVRLRLAYPYDSFTDDDSTALNARALPKADEQSAVEGGWDAWVADSEFVIESGHVELTDSTGNDLTAVLDFGIANVRLGADIKLDSHASYPFTQGLFVFRYQDADNYNCLEVVFATADIYFLTVAKVTAGVRTVPYGVTLAGPLGAGAAWDQGDSARVEMQINDEEVIVWVNDYVQGIFTDVDGFLTETHHGIGGYEFSTTADDGSAGSRAVQWDNFGGWNTMFSGRTDTVEPIPGTDAIANIAAFDDFERLNRHPVFRTTDDQETAKSLIQIVLDATDVAGDRPLLNGELPSSITFLIADFGETLVRDFAKAMGLTGLGELYQIQDDDVGFIWLDGRGTYRYEATDHRDSAPHDTVMATWDDESGGSLPSIAMDPKPRWYDGKDVVENEVFYRFNRASLSLGATVWILEVDDNPDFLDAPPASTLSGWKLIEITALSDGDTLGNIRNPIPGSGYTIDENADGTGVDYLTPLASESGTVSMTATGSPGAYTVLQIDDTGAPFSGSASVGAGSFSKDNRLITVRDASGNTAVGFCVFTDVDGDDTRRNITDWPEDYKNAGAWGSPGWLKADDNFDETDTPLTFDTMLSAAYLVDGFEGETAVIRYLTTETFEASNFLSSALLVADAVQGSNPTAARASDPTSQAVFGRRRVDHTTKYIDRWAIAQGRADARLALRKDERERFQVTIKNLSKLNLMEILYRDVSDRVAVNLAEMGMTARNYWIESYILNLSEGGKNLSMTFTLSKVV